jgi:hypothetical protein
VDERVANGVAVVIAHAQDEPTQLLAPHRRQQLDDIDLIAVRPSVGPLRAPTLHGAK